MIVGTGLIARAFAAHQDALAGTCVYAAGVSNSSCSDPREFERERQRVLAAMADCTPDRLFLYFSTCSIDDPAAQGSGYVLHKKAMEDLVAERDRHLIFRLPQLAGATPNPHTLLNYLYARIVRSERFTIWTGASRNIIDVDDVASIATDLVVAEKACGETINIANSENSSIFDIVRSMEAVLGRSAIFDILDRGAGYAIATDRIQASLLRCRIAFSGDYLLRTIQKYYQHEILQARSTTNTMTQSQ
jgi:nucleoside-diphosphate-sugar epimerase